MRRDKYIVKAHDFEKVQKLLSNREQQSEISLWLGSGYPCMNLLVKGETAHVCFFPSYNHPGYISQNGQDIERSTLINEKDHIEVPVSSIISVDAALEAAKEFCATTVLPKNSEWLEL